MSDVMRSLFKYNHIKRIGQSCPGPNSMEQEETMKKLVIIMMLLAFVGVSVAIAADSYTYDNKKGTALAVAGIPVTRDIPARGRLAAAGRKGPIPLLVERGGHSLDLVIELSPPGPAQRFSLLKGIECVFRPEALSSPMGHH